MSDEESTCIVFFVCPDDLKPVSMAWRKVIRVPAASPAMLPGLDFVSNSNRRRKTDGNLHVKI